MTSRITRAPRQRVPLRSVVLFAVLTVSYFPFSTPAQQTLQEEQQKAIFLRNMLGFVQWPANTERNDPQMLQLCVEGDALLAFALSREFRAVSLDHRKVRVRSLASEQELPGCAVLIVGLLDPKKVVWILNVAGEAQVMTFGQTNGFLEAGGGVLITEDRGAFQFAVNLKAMKNTKAKLDARLLEMAKRILQDGDVAGG
jgi:hypothetical protein